MNKLAAILIIVLIVIGAILIGSFVGQWVWHWVVPDIFAGAVSQNILPATITLWQAFKLSILVSAFIGASRTSSSKK